MAASSGKTRYKSTTLGVFCVCLLFNSLSYCHTLSIPSQLLKLNVPHTAEAGFLVIQGTLNETCVDIKHIYRSDTNRQPSNPFTVQRDGSLVINTPVHDLLGDLFIISPKLSEFCRTIPSVSKLSPKHIAIVHSENGLHFVKKHYEGSIPEYTHAGTKVQGIQQLYACSAVRCSNNLDYRIVGSSAFYLETISNGGHIQLEIYAKYQLGQSQIHHFVIVAQNSKDLQGHTNIKVIVTPTLYPYSTALVDDNLYFAPNVIHRNKRATSETLSVQTVKETDKGVVFSVNPSNSNYKYVLMSSTYQNAFTVRADGTVSVAQYFILDYDSMIANGVSNTVQLVINVLNIADDSVVKELHQTVIIQDVNDELPVFTNKPKPFTAAVNIDAKADTLVYTLTVKDPDADAILNLEQITTTGNDANNYFKVEIKAAPVRAQITRLGNLPFTNNQDFKIFFQATDTAAPAGLPQVVTTELVMHVGTVNPMFMESVYVIEFQEENVVDQQIATIKVFSFQESFVTCTVLDENEVVSTIFETRSENSLAGHVKQCQLFVKIVMDYEKAPRTFNVTIKAREASTQLFTDKVVTISVTDKNEVAPRFSISTYKKENVKESIHEGAVLLSVTATDEDYNSEVTFSVNNDNFQVMPTNSIATQNPYVANIIVNKPLDYDKVIPHYYEFTVKATDHGVINKFGTAKVQIFMTNVNDEPPIFPDTMMVELRYDTDVDDAVYRVQATDADQGDKVSYEFTDSSDKFAIERTTGLIKLKNKIATSQDTIVDFQYILQIRATDDGGCCDGDNTKLSSTGTVTINIQTDNLNRPDFTDCGNYNPMVVEENADAHVIKVTANDSDYGANGVVTYSQRDSNSDFRINSSTGDIYTNIAIDRELLGVSKNIDISVIATDGGNLQGTCSFLVKITDINDNTPKFVINEYDVRVLNTLYTGSVAATVEATDADSGVNGEVIYSFSANGNPNGYFKFDSESATGQIKVAKALPTKNIIILLVEAKDKGNPPLSENVTVTVNIISDPKQSPPQWMGPDSAYRVTVNESIDSSYHILSFSVETYNENVQINFKVVDDDSIFKAIGVISSDKIQTGYLSLKAGSNLDYETTMSYSFTIRATDADDQSSDRHVTVSVTDTNDNIPIFYGQNSKTGWLELSLLEGNYKNVATPGEYIDQIKAIDNDKEPPNNVISNYTIEISKESDLIFSIDSDGKLYTNGIFDREVNHIYTIRVAAFDNAPSAITNDGQHNKGSVGVKIIIQDVNDNPPIFPKDSYTFEAPEDLAINDKIPYMNTYAQVEANDADSDAVLSYSVSPLMSDDPTPPFSIQSQTGSLTVAQPLDYDRDGGKKYKFMVSVYDTIYSSSTTVTINVKNVNDNSPEVDDYDFVDYFENDASVIGRIATVNASDLDGDIDGDGIITFFYSLKFTDDNDAQYFSIGRHSGELAITKSLDRDYPKGKKLFIFMVEVADEDPADTTKTARYGYGTVSVIPKDMNDNAPIFTELTMTVLENQPIGTLVGKVQAVDYDADDNARFDLSIIVQSPDAVFRLDGFDLKTTVKLDRETIDRYSVEMQALDKGNPPQTGYGNLTILVGDVNDNKPYFKEEYTFQLSEHQHSGEFGRIKAYDDDIGQNAYITYTLDDSDAALSYFKMDQDYNTNEGILKIFQDVDYDDIVNLQRSFNLTAYGLDPNPGLNNANRAFTFIQVEVTDYNDEVPTFDQREKSVSIPENANVDKVLATFSATDRDVDLDYSHFEYYIERKSDPTRRFIINQEGEVMILNKLDREVMAQHIVHILAIDNINGSPQNTGTATLTVTVTDINDNYPDFAQDYTKTLMENKLFINSTLLKFLAKDADEPSNGPPFSFEMMCSVDGASEQCTKFTLTEDTGGDNGRGTGTIVVNGEFDRENEKIVSLVIKMCDLRGQNRGDQQCGNRFLNVTIGDTNDNKHADGYQQIVVYNYKGLFKDIEIGSVYANDLDDFDTDKTFNLLDIDVAGKFVSIGQDTGKLTLKPNVPEMSFEVKVGVKDKAGVTTTSTVRIEIRFVTDDAIYSSGSVRIDGISPEDFLSKPKISVGYGPSMLEKFKEQLARKLYSNSDNNDNNNNNVNESDLENVLIFSVMGNESYTDVRFAAHGSPWYQSSRLDGIVTASRDEFDPLLTTDGITNVGKINMVPIDMCIYEICEGGCYNKLIVEDTAKMYNTNGSSYVGVDTRVEGTCGCRAKQFAAVIECTPGYCYHGGECVKDDWGNVRCDCPAGFEGHRCQKLRQGFDGTGYALYKQLEQCEESRTSIEIMTTFDNGLILYMGPIAKLLPTDPTDFLLLELVRGRPRLRIDHGTGEIKIEISGGKSLSDGTWHRIDIYRDKKYVRLVVDHCVDSTNWTDCEGTGVTRGENIYLNTANVLQLGGRMTSPLYPSGVITEKFKGCMKNLIHNAEVYDLSTGGQFPGAKDGCDDEDATCTNGCAHGQCLITGVGGQHKCVCNDGYKITSPSETCDTETTERMLETEGFLDWQIKNTFLALLNSQTMTIRFQFRTRDSDGLIFLVSDRDSIDKYISLKIVSRQLQLSYNMGSDGYTLPLLNVPDVSNGQWHSVTLERYGKQFILKMDSGEGRYYADTLGPTKGAVDFNVRRDQVYGGASVSYSSGDAVYVREDFENSCLNDIRFDNDWFPMTNEESQSPVAVIESIIHSKLGCDWNICSDTKCPTPFQCLDLWGHFECVCEEYHIKISDRCVPINPCDPSPCFGDSGCHINIPPANGEELFTCKCTEDWYGPLCQCNSLLNPGGTACEKDTEPKPYVGIAGGLIIGIVLGILFLIAAVIIIVWLLLFRTKAAEKEPFDEDMEDDIRENIMYYDEEGAGEEDNTQYDLSRLRKPDSGEHPSTWDAPDVHKAVKPLGSSADRPEVGNFINTRLNDADDDPNSPPNDTPHDFNMEGGSSDAGSLSSLNTSSSGSQDYDYLNDWGPKFAKLADMYNNYEDAE